MPTEAIGAVAPEATESTIVMDVDPRPDVTESSKPAGLHSPPDSNNAMALDGSDSELSDIEDLVADQLKDEGPAPAPAPVPVPEPEPAVEDIGEILPDHYSGTVPVFKPTMHQFKDFKRFMEKIDSYGMQSGIVKIIPPQEWKTSLPPLDDMVKQIRVREPIKQDIMGSNGTYRQVNILHQRSYNLPQWRQLCDQSEHQPPARRGERRANAEKPKPATRTRAAASTNAPKSTPVRKRRGRGGRKSAAASKEEAAEPEDRPITPVSPAPEEKPLKSVEDEALAVKKEGIDDEDDDDDAPVVRRMGFTRQANAKTQTVSARRKYSKREGSARIDETAFKDFDYQMDVSDYTPERCEELERTYWKTLTYAAPLYGADLMGTLFDESTEDWNLNKLPNLLDVLGTKVPGVNTAYLYLGMWKATFAWHLEDVDLYSINYLHFGAPKQWYSISQKDARRFEAAMKNIWPTEAKSCDQFLRHKGFLISPSHLKQHYNITVNKCVSYPGEFVVTYPYGYHSGYNLGYNCAEAVNFALDSWLPIGKIAKKCECAQAQDSVWVDVYEIERKLRGESTEYEETEDEEEEEEEDEGDNTGLPSPPSSHTVRAKAAGTKRKRAVRDKDGKVKVKKIRLRLKAVAEPVCCLCPNDIPGAEILPTDDGRKAHRMCALYVPETYIETVDDKEIVANAANIDKARLDLKCLFCRSKKGACFQCSQKKCARSYHATCAAAAGVFVEEEEVPVFAEDGTEYKEQAFEFSCRFHRTKRDKKLDGDVLDGDARVREAAAALKKGRICQLQYYRGDIFAGVVVENRHDEQTLLLDVIPNGDRIEVEWKWLLLPNPADLRLPKASPNAVPMPTSRKAKQEINATKRVTDELPRKDETFVEGFTWAEFHTGDIPKNDAQTKLDLFKENQIWHYLGKTSTESRAQYAENLAKPVHNPRSNFLDTIPRPAYTAYTARAPAPQPRRSYSAVHPTQAMPPPQSTPTAASKAAKPYVYKPRKPVGASYKMQYTPEKFAPKDPAPAAGRQQHLAKQQLSFGTDPRFMGPTAPPSSNRFAPVGGSNGFPQLPGLTRPPAHMKSGHYPQPQSRVWPTQPGAPGSRPYHHVPMTSSLLKPGAPRYSQADGSTTRPGMSAFQKYSFFQVHHNRDSSRYRTPYAAWGGFTNGYEGNLRAFLVKAQQALSGNKGPVKGIPAALLQPFQSGIHSPAPANTPPSSGYGSPYAQQRSTRPQAPSEAWSAASPTTYNSPHGFSPHHAGQYPQTPASTGSFATRQPGSTPLHPAIRPQYGATWQHDYTPAPGQFVPDTRPQTRPQSQSPAPAPPRAPAFAKQSHSPIPLPPYVKQPSQATPTNGARPPPTMQDPRQAVTSPSNGQSPFYAGSRATVSPVPVAQTPQANQPSQFGHHGRVGSQPLGIGVGDAISGPVARTEASPTTDPISTTVPGLQHCLQAPSVGIGFQMPQYEQGPPMSVQDPATSPVVRELPEVPAESMALVEKMMLNLRRASQKSDVAA